MPQEPGPEVQGVPVTARNWQDPPANRWAFWHVGEILPTYRVSRGDGPVRALPPASPAVDDRLGLLAVTVARADGSPGTVGDVLTDTFTDAYLVLQDGELVTERYGPLGAADRPHALMSVSKSVVGCVAAVLIDRGQLDPDREITGYVPELAASGYAGALVRHAYDCAPGSGSWRSTPTRSRTSGGWTSGSAAGNRQGRARASPAGSTGSWPRCLPRRRTARDSCTARRSRTCWAGCASTPPDGPWPRSCPS